MGISSRLQRDLFYWLLNPVLHKLDRIELLVPVNSGTIHFQAAFYRVVRSDQVQQPIPNLSNPQPQEYDAAILARAAAAVMFVKVSVAVPANLDCKAYRESADGLSAQMGDRCLRRKTDPIARAPHPPTQVHFIKLIEELFVKAAQFLEQIAT